MRKAVSLPLGLLGLGPENTQHPRVGALALGPGEGSIPLNKEGRGQ